MREGKTAGRISGKYAERAARGYENLRRGHILLFRQDWISLWGNNAMKEALQDQPATVVNFAIVQKDGARTVVRRVAPYNLDVAKAYSISRGIFLKGISAEVF